MTRDTYHAITIPEGLYRALEQYVRESNGYYVSIAEVVREALRDYLRKLHEKTDR